MAEDDDATSESEEDGGEGAAKKGGKGLLFGLIGAVLLGGGGFYASFSGLIPIGGSDAQVEAKEPETVMVASALPVFVPVEDLVISLGTGAKARHLKFGMHLDVEPVFMEEVETLKPRILDIVNTFLRAVEERDIESPTAMTRLRAQLLRRVQIITGEGRVRDLLITEFVLN